MKLYVLIATTAILISLGGCKTTTGKDGEVIAVKPSRAQIEAMAKRVVCDSFDPITFSYQGDTELTIKQIREFNAAWNSFGCKLK